MSEGKEGGFFYAILGGWIAIANLFEACLYEAFGNWLEMGQSMHVSLLGLIFF